MPMSPRLLRPIASGDPDARRYIAAVQQADGAALETAVRKAINDFVVGCKQDGIWSAIKAAVFLAGPRTLAGINVPLVGPAPTFNAFTASEYNRETGLVGNGSTMYIDSGRNNNADPQDSQHMAVYASSVDDALNKAFIGAGADANGSSQIVATGSSSGVSFRSRQTAADTRNSTAVAGLIGVSRAASPSYNTRAAGSNVSVSRTSQAPHSGSILVFARNSGTNTVGLYGAHRLAFYSIGESLDLALLETRVSDYITAIGAAI